MTFERFPMPVFLNGASGKRQGNCLVQYKGKWDSSGQPQKKKIATQIQVITSKQINPPQYS